MIESKAWEWGIVKGKDADYWKEPSIESYYLLNRWTNQNRVDFLDLGCGLGRHTIQFAKACFNTFAFDLSEESVQYAKQWAEKERLLRINFKVGDMLKMPYDRETMDCILCKNVISHTDTEGIKKVINKIYGMLRKGGECYLTLASKETWGFKQDWPLIDENTKIRIEDGPENGIPHFYADKDLILELFSKFEIIIFNHIEDMFIKDGIVQSSWHYHLLIKK